MGRVKVNTQGFTLIAALLILLLLSGITVGLLMMVNTEGRVGNNDVQNSLAYRAAEGAVEKMTSDLANKYQTLQAPAVGDITGLSALLPPDNNVTMTYPVYSVTPTTITNGAATAVYGQVKSGPYHGLYAQITPITLNVTAQRISGGQEQVSMTRNVEIAMIPVFQFGVFSESDLGFFSSPNLNFAGRVHTNGDLYLGVANGYTLTFHDYMTAYGNVVRKRLPNGLDATNGLYNDGGTVYIPTQSGGCDINTNLPNCRPIAQSEGSVTGGGGNPPVSGYTIGPPSWQTISNSYYNNYITDGNYGNAINTGVSKLSLPFVGGGALPYEIIRQPPNVAPPEIPTSPVGASRLYNQAAIRILLADDPSQLPGGAGDAQNVRLWNGPTNGPDYTKGVVTSVPAGLPGTTSAKPYSTYFAEATNTAGAAPYETTGLANCVSSATVFNPDWPNLPTVNGNIGLLPAGAPVTVAGSRWNLLDGYLRVEVLINGVYTPVTQQWLALGFARGLTPPAAPGANPVNPKAILLFQMPADRNGNGVIDPAGAGCGGATPKARPAELLADANAPVNAGGFPFYGDSGAAAQSPTRNNWYPINFYDAREGEVRDVQQAGGNTSCTPSGIMNAVELDVGNLKNWLSNDAVGQTVNFANQNGYVLYFSDRRGMRPNPNGTVLDPPGTLTGDSGLEDSINSSAAAGTPDNVLEPKPPGKTQSPEDVNGNGLLDAFGEANLGNGFNLNTAGGNQYARITNCMSNIGNGAVANGRKNWVSGARHVLKLVDGALGNVPTQPGGTGGFTVGSENPVYIQGNYNTNAGDPIWAGGASVPHAAAGVIADSVMVLSNSWSDLNSFAFPTQPATGRIATTTYYRVAIAGGKNINFPDPAWNAAVNYGFGTDGGVHNFLRFLEDWSGSTLNYEGSLVSLYYSTYNTGTFKCCTYSVYQPPTRNYVFDPLFAQPQNLPPGTPMFRDIDNLSYRQNYVARTN
jgi:Tfp pilus assembly protein PilX